MWNDSLRAYREPVSPFTPLGVLHLAGPAKRTAYDIQRTTGGSFRTRLLSRTAAPV